jgi:hypothetical protein
MYHLYNIVYIIFAFLYDFFDELNFYTNMNRKTTDAKSDSMLDVEAAKVLRMHGGSEPLELVKVQDLVNKYFKKAEDV